jgi:DNA polymerase (family 10)
VDLEALVERARQTGVALEINGSPERLDLNDENARYAKEAGVLLSLGTDAHHDDHLDFMRFAVAVARRGWCEPANILNTRPYEQLRDWLRARRR